jgi:type VI secretion system protein VasI
MNCQLRRLVAGGLLVLSTAATCEAERSPSKAKAVARCAAVGNDVERLACYDAFAKLHGLASSKSVVSGTGQWKVRTDTSPVDDSQSVYLSASADSPIAGWPNQRVTPTLWLRCREHKTEAYVETGMAANPEYGSLSEVTVTLRLDRDRAFKLQASQSTNREALFLPGASGLMKRFFGKEKLLFSFTPFNSSAATTTFPIGGLSEAIKPLRNACKW